MIRVRSTRWKVFVLSAALSGSTAYAQTFEERFSAFSLRPSGPTTTFVAPAPAAPSAPSAPTAPQSTPIMPASRPALRADVHVPAAPVAVRARQEELLVSAYAPEPSAQAATQNPFGSWLPRLMPTAVEAPPATESGSPAEVEALDRGIISEQLSHGRRVPDELAALIAAQAHK